MVEGWQCRFRSIAVTGGVSDAKRAPDVLSLGTAYNQPFWIFYSSNQQLDQLSQLKGKRIAVGPVGSATRFTAEQILGQGGITAETATFLPFAGSAADKALNDGAVDAVWIIGVPEATAVQSFLRNLKVRLMSFPTAEAFSRLFFPISIASFCRKVSSTSIRISRPSTFN